MHEILVCDVLSFRLAFGLDWQPLISGRASRAARSVARQRKASHIVLDGDAPASFGYGLLRLRRATGRRAVHSAAQNVARLYPSGSVALVMPIGAQGHWLVAVHEGAVMSRTDVIHRSPEQAHLALQALQQAHPRLVVLGSDPKEPNLEVIAGASDTGTLLRDTGRRHRQWLLWGGCLLLAGTALVVSRSAWSPGPDQVAPALDAAQIESLWRDAVAGAEQRIILHGVAATHAALRHLYGVPAQIGGWALSRVACAAEGPMWRCSADYDRRHDKANNEGLLTAVPQAWRLSFPSIDRANATWQFTTGVVSLTGHRLDTFAYNRRHLQSAWQGIRPAFGRVVWGPARPVEVVVPLDSEGRPLPRPPGLPNYSRSAVEFEGPLRSVSLLLPHTGSIGWRSITLTLGAPLQPTLASSRLRASLHGDLYELHDAP